MTLRAYIDRHLIAVARERGYTGCNVGEARVWLELLRAHIGTPEQQFNLGPYRLDFAYPALAVAIEVDGWVHTAASVARADARRDRRLAEWGWRVYRVDACTLEGIDYAVGVIRHMIKRPLTGLGEGL